MGSLKDALVSVMGDFEYCPDCGIEYTDTAPATLANPRGRVVIQLEEGCDHCTPIKTQISELLATLRKGTY